MGFLSVQIDMNYYTGLNGIFFIGLRFIVKGLNKQYCIFYIHVLAYDISFVYIFCTRIGGYGHSLLTASMTSTQV